MTCETESCIPTALVHTIPGKKAVSYHRHEELGHGGFAKVFRGTTDLGNEVAIKVTAKFRLAKPKTQQKNRSEVDIQLSLDHPNVVRALDFFEDDNFTYLILELCQRGSLKTQLRARGRFSEQETIRYLRDIMNCLAYLHDNRILHRDLKLENFLVDNSFCVKIADFGLSAQLDHDDERRFSVCGTPNYLSPEMISDASKGVSYEVDIWAIGVSTFAMLTGRLPFQKSEKKETYAQIKKCAYSFPSESDVSLAAKQFIGCLLQLDPKKRPSARDVSDHPFLSEKVEPIRKPLKEVVNRTITKKDSQVPVPDFFVSRFCDHSDKYGLGYLLLNGTVGACFNDLSRMAIDPHGVFIHYWDSYAVQDPAVLAPDGDIERKKITILARFADSLKKSRLMFRLPAAQCSPSTPLVHVKYWLRTEQAVLFRMQDRNIQVNFADHQKLFIFWSQKELMLAPSILDAGTVIPLSQMNHRSDASDEKARFLIAKEMLSVMNRV
jgi:polo-like kinase 1